MQSSLILGKFLLGTVANIHIDYIAFQVYNDVDLHTSHN